MPAAAVPSLVANWTLTPPAAPPLRISVIVAGLAPWATTNEGPANWITPPASSSAIVSVACAGGTMLTPVGLPSVKSTVRLPCTLESFRIGTVNVFVATPAAKLSVPATAW